MSNNNNIIFFENIFKIGLINGTYNCFVYMNELNDTLRILHYIIQKHDKIY